MRTFVVDNETELGKFADAPRRRRLLVRLTYRSPHAKSDLSSKFGVGPFEAANLVARARRTGTRVAGFSFHVGSQLDDPPLRGRRRRHARAHGRPRARYRVRFDTLDIGGGFPMAYDKPHASIETVADGCGRSSSPAGAASTSSPNPAG